MSTTSITVRLDSTVLQEIDSKCNTELCTRSDFIKKAISEALNTEIEPENPPKRKMEIGKVYDDDGNIVGTIRQSS